MFVQELNVYEGGTAYWFPVQEVLVPAMWSEFRLGQRIEVFVISMGHVRGRHVFLINAFDDGAVREVFWDGGCRHDERT